MLALEPRVVRVVSDCTCALRSVMSCTCTDVSCEWVFCPHDAPEWTTKSRSSGHFKVGASIALAPEGEKNVALSVVLS